MKKISVLMPKEKIEEVLLRNPILASLSLEKIKEIGRHSTHINLESNNKLFAQGAPARAFFYLHKGRVKLYRLSENGDEKIIEIIEPGNLFAFTLLFMDNSRYPVNAATLVSSEIISISSKHFSSLLRESTDLCFKIMAAMSTRMMGLIQEIDALSLHSGSSRVASYLLAHTSDKKPVYQLPVSKKTLALRLSIKPETLSRIIRCLADAKVIRVNDKEVEILKRSELSSTVCPIID